MCARHRTKLPPVLNKSSEFAYYLVDFHNLRSFSSIPHFWVSFFLLFFSIGKEVARLRLQQSMRLLLPIAVNYAYLERILVFVIFTIMAHIVPCGHHNWQCSKLISVQEMWLHQLWCGVQLYAVIDHTDGNAGVLICIGRIDVRVEWCDCGKFQREWHIVEFGEFNIECDEAIFVDLQVRMGVGCEWGTWMSIFFLFYFISFAWRCQLT